jgi:hypothetical protein
MNDIEKGKVRDPLYIMTKDEVMNDLLQLLGLVQKHSDKEGCQHCLDLRKSVNAGAIFGSTINVSQNAGSSGLPAISVSPNNF